MPIHYPLISEMIDKSRKSPSIYKLIYTWGYHTVQLNKVMSGQQHLLLGGIFQAIGYVFWHDSQSPHFSKLMNDVLKMSLTKA